MFKEGINLIEAIVIKEIIGIVSSVFPKINNIHTINTIVQTATNSKKNLGIEVIKNL